MAAIDVAPSSPAELERLENLIDQWVNAQRDNPAVADVGRTPADAGNGGADLWFIRVNGDEKSVFTVWFQLRQRSVFVETYVLPAPLENTAAVYEYVLRKNPKIFGMGFGIGEEDGIYLTGEIHNDEVDTDELDRMLGTAYVVTEQCFRPGMRLGFGAKFSG